MVAALFSPDIAEKSDLLRLATRPLFQGVRGIVLWCFWLLEGNMSLIEKLSLLR